MKFKLSLWKSHSFILLNCLQAHTPFSFKAWLCRPVWSDPALRTVKTTLKCKFPNACVYFHRFICIVECTRCHYTLLRNQTNLVRTVEHRMSFHLYYMALWNINAYSHMCVLPSTLLLQKNNAQTLERRQAWAISPSVREPIFLLIPHVTWNALRAQSFFAIWVQYLYSIPAPT